MLAGFACALLFNTVNFSTLSYDNTSRVIKDEIGGEKITGEFTANQNDLGIIKLKFSKFTRIDIFGGAYLMFTIKEQKSKDWLFMNSYYIGTDKHTLDLLIGFPVIQDSLNKKYVFEITPQDKSGKSYFYVSGEDPSFQTIYKFSKKEITGSKKRLISFILNKILLSITNIDFLLSSFVYFLPVIYYAVLIYFRRKVKTYKILLSYTAIIFMLTDSLVINYSYSGISIGLLVLWGVVSIMAKLESTVSFLMAFIFLILLLFLMALRVEAGQATLAIYIYGFLIVGTSQMFYEVAKKIKHRIGIKEYLKVLKLK